MDHKPIIVSRRVLLLLFTEFAARFGTQPPYAEAMAQVFLQLNSKVLDSWFEFFRTQCAQCPDSPETCRFFNLPSEKFPKGKSPADIQGAYEFSIGSGRLRVCPVRLSKNPA